jgi:hypothetical protein
MLAYAGAAVARGPGCRVEPFDGASTTQGAIARMHVINTARGCTIVNLGAPAERRNPAQSGAITEQPKHGSATFVAPDTIYTPERGYVGDDEFAYEAFARGAGDRPVRLKVRVKVTVVAP